MEFSQNDFFQKDASENPEKEAQKIENQVIPINKTYELDVATRPNWSVEANFMILPIFTFDKKQGDKAGRIIHSVPIVKNGTVFTSKLVISATGVEKDGKVIKDSLPGAFDMQVLFCLMDMWDEQGRSEKGQVLFRLNTVCTRLKMNDSGRSYEQIRNSIYKLKFTAIESTKAFYSADKADHISIPITMIEDYAITSHRGNTKNQDSCMVIIGKHILSNLMRSYRATINRKIYQQLDVGFAQRILCLVVFRQQIEYETGVIDFELNELASLIPISGKLYPSTIMSRLENALNELLEKKVFKHEYVKVGKTHVLRLTPFEQPENFLLGSGHIERFERMVEKVYKKSLFDLVGLTSEALERKLDRDTKVIEYGARKYSWVFHGIDVLLAMMKAGYEARNPSSVLKAILETDEKKIEIPDSFVPVDVQYKELLTKEQLNQLVQTNEQVKNDADDIMFRTALSYVGMLAPSAYEKYSKTAAEIKPLVAQSKSFMSAEIAELIFQDMKAGKKIELQGPAIVMQTQLEGNA